jgi:glucoamylase
MLCDYVSFSEICQTSALAIGHFFRASYQVDGSARDWSDQKDGPALQSLAFVEAWPFLDGPSRATATRVAQRNLEETVAHWQDDDQMFGPWEDVHGPSFFARAAQVRFLEEVSGTNTLGLNPPAAMDTALDGLRNALGTHWDDAKRCYLSIPGGAAGDPTLTDVSGFDPNVDIVLACVYGSIPCTDPKLLATAAQVRAVFDVGGSTGYPINAADRNDPDRGFGPMIGRYPSDTYDGNVGKDKEFPTKDHPWALCTANFAQLYFLVAHAFDAGAPVPFDELTGPFFDQVGLGEATVNDPADATGVATALRSAGDKMLQAVLFHSDHYRLSEQFDGTTGYEESVSDLTWSYAAYLSAVRTR